MVCLYYYGVYFAEGWPSRAFNLAWAAAFTLSAVAFRPRGRH